MLLSEPSVVKTLSKTFLKKGKPYQTPSNSLSTKKSTSGVLIFDNSGIYVEQIFIKDMTMSKELQRDLSMTSKT
jgi:hypothetical protein